MNSNILKIKIQNFSEIFNLSNQLKSFDYRGQEKSDWPLISTYERILTIRDSFQEIEKAVIIDFKVKSINYLNNIPADDDPFKLLSYIQHYGGYTRLLDFTRSLYIATYFAFEDATDKSSPVIWALNHKKIDNHFKKIINKEKIDVKYHDNSNFDNSLFFNDILLNKIEAPEKLILKIQPMMQFQRLGIQQSVFYSIVNPIKNFDEQLSEIIGLHCAKSFYDDSDLESYNLLNKKDLNDFTVIKISFDKSIDPIDILKELWKMNINSETLFPGLDGFAKSLRYTVKINK